MAEQEQRHESARQLSFASVALVRRGQAVARACLCLSLLGVVACGHASRTQAARTALDEGNPNEALELYNEELEVESAADLPDEFDGEQTLLILDRSMVLQQLSEYALSSRDLELADKRIEVLDFTRSSADDIARYLFSDDTGPYKAPPYEKLMINTMNMVNYLVRGNLRGGRVEARRFTVMQDYLQRSSSDQAVLLGAGSYLAGFIFEKSGEPQTALRYYDEALQYDQFRTLDAPIARLAESANYRTPRLNAAIERGQKQTASPTESEEAEVLVVLNYGRVPAKVATRLPIGLALTHASGSMSPADARRANDLAAQGLVTWVNFPTMEKPRRKHHSAQVQVGSQAQPLDAVDIDRLAIEAWKEGEGAVIASAITRMISRVVAGQVARSVGGDDGVGVLLSLVTQASLTAADTPDTRSWATLPARIALGRFRVPAGTHQVTMQVGSKRVERRLELKAGGWAALNLTLLQ